MISLRLLYRAIAGNSSYHFAQRIEAMSRINVESSPP